MIFFNEWCKHLCLQDVYLHTNCLATLANMAPHVHRLSAYASQRLISLFDMISRKYVAVQLNIWLFGQTTLSPYINCMLSRFFTFYISLGIPSWSNIKMIRLEIAKMINQRSVIKWLKIWCALFSAIFMFFFMKLF